MTDTNILGSEILLTPGHEWTLSHVTPGIRQRFSGICKALARQAARGDPEAQNCLTAAIAAGDYSWGSPFDPNRLGSALQVMLNSEAGNALMLRLLLEKTHQEVPDAQIVEIFQSDPEGVAETMARALGFRRPDPNATTPEKTGEKETTPTTNPASSTA